MQSIRELRPLLRGCTVLVAFVIIAAPTFGARSDPNDANDARALVEAKFAAVSHHSATEIAAFYADDAVLTASDFCAPRRGRPDVERTYVAIFAAVPDVTAEVQELVVEGDRVAARVVLHSRMPGRAFDLPIMDFFTVRARHIVRDDGLFDNHGRRCRA
jgi:predicted ester cyclase